MAILTSGKMEKDAVEIGASLMAVSARTAPKTRGIDSVKTLILTGSDLEPLAAAMEKKVEEKSTPIPFFKRDADNIRNSAAVLLIGVSRDPKKWNSRSIAARVATGVAGIFWLQESGKGRISQGLSVSSRQSIWGSPWVQPPNWPGN